MVEYMDGIQIFKRIWENKNIFCVFWKKKWIRKMIYRKYFLSEWKMRKNTIENQAYGKRILKNETIYDSKLIKHTNSTKTSMYSTRITGDKSH